MKRNCCKPDTDWKKPRCVTAKRNEGTDTAADPGGGDTGKSLSAGCQDEPGRTGGLFIWDFTKELMRGAFGNRASRFFCPEGRTYSPPTKWAVVLPAATVRSARRMRLLREPYVQCHITSVLLPLATQSAICFASSSKLLFPFWKQPAACPHKAATGSFICGYGYRLPQYPFSFCEKETKTRAKGR